MDLYRHFQSGKPEPRTQPSISCRISPGQALATERLSLHASMLRALECLYKSRNVHREAQLLSPRWERNSFQADATNAIGAKRRPDPPWALAANAKEPRRGRFAVCKGVWGSEPGPARALGEGASGARREGRRTRRASRTSTRRRPRSRRPCAGPQRRRRPTPPSRRPTASSFRIFCPERLLR